MRSKRCQQGVDETLANKAIGQLFQASGAVLGRAKVPPRAHVAEMIAYAGTTAAGLEAIKTSSLAEAIERGLNAA